MMAGRRGADVVRREAWDLAAVDFAIVGGGPAGMSAALVASLNQVDTMLLERSARLGGQVRWADAPVLDLLGAHAEGGNQLADLFAAHLRSSRATIRVAAAVDAVRRSSGRFRLSLAGGEELTARRVLLATGLDHRRLNVPGEELADRIATPRATLQRLDARTVAVVGGGDEASSLARDLALRGARVTLLVRGKVRARPIFAGAVRRQAGVEIREGAAVARLEGGDLLSTVVLTSGEEIATDLCFVRIGVEPVLPRLEPPLELQADGRVRVDAELRTSSPGLFAAGDLVRPPGEHYIASALADGTVVARKVEADLAGR